ncbi:MAG: FGGY-family carbohydrate kinase [Nannocystaceae bacterium]
MTAEHVLAIDLGTSGPKVALLDRAGAILGAEFEPVELLLLPGGGAEQRPDEWWRAIVAATRRLLARGLAPARSIVALACTSQWSGTVAVDEAGRPLHNAILWMDSRGARHIQAVVGGWPSVQGYGLLKLARWLKITGGLPGRSGKDPTAHILWLKAERPEVHAAAAKFLEPKDYLNLRLTGRVAASYDSIALHWVTDNRDLRRVDYHDGLLAAAGLERRTLPELKRSVDILGPLLPEVAQELGLEGHVQVVMGTPDVQAAALGSGAIADFEPHFYIGTSSWLTCHVPFKKTDIGSNIASLPSAIPERYFVANEQETSGACLAFLRDKLFFPTDALTPEGPPPGAYGRFDALAAESPAGASGLLFLPWLNGERTPLEDHRLRGGFLNVSLSHGRGDFIRAVLEGVAYNMRWLLGAVDKFTGRRAEVIRVIGGGAGSTLWCQILADVSGRTILQVADPVAAGARGAGILALVGLGLATFEELGPRVAIAGTFAPRPAEAAIYEPHYAEFQAALRANRPIFGRLNRHL